MGAVEGRWRGGEGGIFSLGGGILLDHGRLHTFIDFF